MRKIDQGNLGLLQGGGEKDEGGRERNLGDGEAPGHEDGVPAILRDAVRDGGRAGRRRGLIGVQRGARSPEGNRRDALSLSLLFLIFF
jgi:hypothetical protein